MCPSHPTYGPTAGNDRCPDRKRLHSTALAIILVIGAFGCSSTGSLEPLQVTLVDLQITEVTLFETGMVAKLRVTNPNPEALTIDGASFKLILDDKKIGTGTTKETFTVERLDSAVVDAVFHINNASALLRLKGIMDKTEVSYGVRGHLYTQGSFGTKKLNVDKMGTINLADMKGVD
jgi:LEA14-like dessication related protein